MSGDFFSSHRFAVVLLVASLALLPLMISNESLWLDEGDTALYAIQPTIGDWWQRLIQDKNADCQMPLTMLTAWAGAQLIGINEWALRLQNVIWGIVALVALFRTGHRVGNPWLPVVLAVQPFFWFYMDEARPYLAQVALGSLLLCLLASYETGPVNERKWLSSLLIGALVLFGTSMLCAVTLAAVISRMFIENRRKLIRIFTGHPRLVWCFLALFGLLSAYYLWTLSKGAGGSRIWAVDLKSLAFIFYELTGCVGLGPSLDSIRAAAKDGQFATLAPELLLPGFLVVVLLGNVVTHFNSSKNRSRVSLSAACLFILIFVGTIMILASVALRKPLWARHFSSVLPFLVFIEAAVLHQAIISGNWMRKTGIIVLCGLLAFSAFQIRYSQRFEKDDYRRAAETAITELQNGREVWWSAAEYPAVFYHVPLNRDGKSPGAAVLHSGIFVAPILPRDPDVIVFTRPEVYDPFGTVSQFIHARGYQVVEKPKNFTIYVRPGEVK